MSNVQAIGHVIRILDEYTLLIDVGRSQLSVDDEIEIYELGDPIRDINGNFLSEYIHVKDWHSNFIMVRWSPTEMVVVETTSENPSYRYAEGGIFSFYGYICLW